MDDIRPKRFEFIESFFPLSMAVLYRSIFMTELWRLSIIPRVSEKKHWVNTSTVNNETIEMQMQMVPTPALSEETQRQMIETYGSLPLDESHIFVNTWAHTLHALALETAILVEAINTSTTNYMAVTTEHCRVVQSSNVKETKQHLTQRAFASQMMPNITSVVPEAASVSSEPAFIHLFLLNPKYPDLSTIERQSEVKLLTRFLTVRGRDNACFNLFSNVMFHTPTMIEDCGTIGSSLTTQETGIITQPIQQQRKLFFTLEPCWPMYQWRFVWVAATRILLMRLYFLLRNFQEGKYTWKESTEMMTPGGLSPVFEIKFEAGDLALEWEKELVSKREEMFESTEGFPIAFQKREISWGYSDVSYYHFLQQTILSAEYGKRISRCTVFDRYDQEETIMRMEFIDPIPLKTSKDANEVFMSCIEKAIDQIKQFYELYRDTW